MPFVNRKGQIAHGTGSAGARLNNVQFDGGNSACWLTATQLIYQHGGEDGWYLAAYDPGPSPPTYGTVHSNGCNTLFASGLGQWAAYLYGYGVFSNVGFYDAAASLLGMGRDGSIAYRPNALETVGFVLRMPSGEELHLSNGSVEHVSIVDSRQVLWTEANALKSYQMPDIHVLDGGVWNPKAVLVAGKWWIAYYSANYGIVLHPVDEVRGMKPVTTPGDAYWDMVVLEGTNKIRFAWATTVSEESVQFRDIDVTKETLTILGTGSMVPGEGPQQQDFEEVDPAGVRVITSSASYGVAGAAEELVLLPIEVFPAYPAESGRGRIIHPTLGAFDYEVKPDEWVNIDAEAIIPPVWASSRTLTSAANVLWQGNLRDVVVEERWKSLGGLAMPITQLRMLLAIWTTPMDPDVGYVQWFPNYITSVGFRVIPVNLSAGGQGIAFDDIVNYKDENGEPIGWMTSPVTFQLKLVERL